MFDLLKQSELVFGSEPSTFREIASDVHIEIDSVVGDLPDGNTLQIFINNIMERDNLRIDIKSFEDFSYNANNKDDWQSEYKSFIDALKDDDEVKIKVNIDKKYENHTISIYSFRKFWEYYSRCDVLQLMKFFTDEFKTHQFLRFDVLDTNVCFYTHSIGFCSADEAWPVQIILRNDWIQKCETASLFLNRTDIRLTPMDFEILDKSGDTQIAEVIFRKLETLLSLLHLANSSYITDNTIVVQFSPEHSGFDYPIYGFFDNRFICDIFKWAFKGENITEKFGIVRNVINANSKTADQIKTIDSSILNSIKSNYMLYQNKTLEHYVKVKNDISKYIVETTQQLQEILHSVVDGLKNNFIAVILFFITTLLTDKINWNDFISYDSLDDDVKPVIYIFLIASFCYLGVSIFSLFLKYHFYKIDYKRLRDNYSSVLDENDLDNAFTHDDAFKASIIRIRIYSIITCVLWVLFLLIIFFWVHNK